MTIYDELHTVVKVKVGHMPLPYVFRAKQEVIDFYRGRP